MPELILPGVYIDTRAEALIVPAPVTVGNIGIVGTARQGPLNTPVILSSYGDATSTFGFYDGLDDADESSTPVTLVRALELAYSHGASTVFAVRVVGTGFDPQKAIASLKIGDEATLTAKQSGAVGNRIKVAVDTTSDAAVMAVTISLDTAIEVYNVKTGTELVTQINAGSRLVDATAGANPATKPAVLAAKPLDGGANGANAGATEYKAGFGTLLNENVHLMVAAGLDEATIGDVLKAHVEEASLDKNKHDRIAIVSPRVQDKTKHETDDAYLNYLKSRPGSDRVVFVAPTVMAPDAATKEQDPEKKQQLVNLPGYGAAAIAGMLSARDPHVSLTNKTLNVRDVAPRYNSGQLEQLVQNGVLALELARGVHVVRAITTDRGAFQQITTRRIVDFAKFGVRAAADPFIGLLNNDRVRKALKGAINGFLANMVDDEMIVSYELDVSATRDDEIRGIAKVIMTLRPTFSIDFIKVTMFLG